MRRLHAGSRAHKFELSIHDVVIHLESASSRAVAVDNVTFVWVRGRRRSTTKHARVVEKLDQTSGVLTRTAAVAADLSIPCTLFWHGSGEDGSWEQKLSHLHISDADADEGEEALLCAVPFELSAHAASVHAPTRRSRVELPLADGMGSVSLAVCCRLLSGGGADDSTVASDTSNVHDLEGFAADEGGMVGAPAEHDQIKRSSSFARSSVRRVSDETRALESPPEKSREGNARDATEARWQGVYELERSRADAATIERLQADVAALINDKRGLSEQLLRLRATVSHMHEPRKQLVERVAELDAQLAAAKREAVANEEQLTTAFSGVMAGLEEEVSTLTAQRDDAVTKLEIAERKLAARRFGACSNLHAAPATRAADDAARRSDTGAPSAPSAPDGARQQPGGEAAHEPPTLRALNLRAAEEKGTPDGKAKSRLRAAAGGMRRALSFDRAGGKRGSKAPKDQPSPKSDGDAGRENALGRLAE